jgi:hypothetical protein
MNAATISEGGSNARETCVWRGRAATRPVYDLLWSPPYARVMAIDCSLELDGAVTSTAYFAAQHKSRSGLLAIQDPAVAPDAQSHGATASIQQAAHHTPNYDSRASQASKQSRVRAARGNGSGKGTRAICGSGIPCRCVVGKHRLMEALLGSICSASWIRSHATWVARSPDAAGDGVASAEPVPDCRRAGKH